MGRIKLGICLKSLGLPFRRSLAPAQNLGAAALELEATGELLPQNLTQAQRDFFGAHTYERVDKPGVFHTGWMESEQPPEKPAEPKKPSHAGE